MQDPPQQLPPTKPEPPSHGTTSPLSTSLPHPAFSARCNPEVWQGLQSHEQPTQKSRYPSKNSPSASGWVVKIRSKNTDGVIYMNNKLMIGFLKENWYGRRWIFQNVRTFCFDIFQNENVDILQEKKNNLDFSLMLNVDSSIRKLNKIIHFMSRILRLG